MADTSLQILIVDDDAQFRRTFTDVLKANGYEALAVGYGDEALEIAAHQMPTVAVIDLRLPDTSGLELLGQVKEVSPDTECIVLTGYASQQSAIEAVNLGAYSYVQKPYDLEQLLLSIRRAREKCESNRALRKSEQNYRVLVEQSLQGMVVAQGIPPRLVFANRAIGEILGYSAQELLSLSTEEIPNLIHPEDRSFFFQRYADRLQGRPAPPGYEVRGMRKDGSVCWLELHSGPIVYGGHPAVQAVFIDVSDRKQAERELLKSYETVQENLMGTVNALAAAVEKRDPYTAGHQRRVAQLAAAIARELSLPEDRITGVLMAGLIHDIGKIFIPAEILSKPSKLNEIEMMMIRTHSQAGYDVLSTVDFPWPVAEMVLQHHERMNGSGYPRGLSGEEILQDVPILSVADAADAMASRRPYRAAHSTEATLEEVTQSRGALYDHDAVDAVLKLVAQDGYKLGSG